MSVERFVVDSRLLRELGERLVGRPHIALAEIIKNSYDADARAVDVYFSDDEIKIVDDGHGMSHTDFSKRWLTIGTTVKEQNRESPELRRPFTGSKGVGRLSVQLLARHMQLRTVGLVNPALPGRKRRHQAGERDLYPEVSAEIDWEKAVSAGHIEDVEVDVLERPRSEPFADGSPSGTELVLTNLTHKWNAEAFRDLARELWPLQPPFAIRKADDTSFEVVLHSPYQRVVSEFRSQMRAILDIWTARVTGRLLPISSRLPAAPLYQLQGDSSLDILKNEGSPSTRPTRLLAIMVEIRRGTKRELIFEVPDCHIDELSYEIRIFSFAYRQPRGVKVDTARQYMLSYGGVHIYDAGFHLPYYGPENDWLKIEQDAARRISVSRLLPTDLQVPRGMLDLVGNSRIYGAVQISSTHEAEAAQQYSNSLDDILTVQITRDRLASNAAFDELRRLVRAGMDLYAMESARAKFTKARSRREQVKKSPSSSLRDTGENLGSIRDALPEESLPEFDLLKDKFEEAIADAEAIEYAAQTQASLLGALATAGMTALAYEHEISKQVATVESLALRITRLAKDAPVALREPLNGISNDLSTLAGRTKRIKEIFAPLTDEENRASQDAGTAYGLVSDLVRAIEVLSRGTKVRYEGLPRSLRFPRGGYVAWWAIFQNVLINAFNATLDTEQKQVAIDGSGNDTSGAIRVQDTGIGIDIRDADRLFEPFERGRPVSRERAALALGGSGLGLTIVRLIANEIGIRVSFESPDPGFSTSVRISWGQGR